MPKHDENDLYSVAHLSRIYGCHRSVITKRIQDLLIEPAGERRKSPVYFIGDVSALIKPDRIEPEDDPNVLQDPTAMGPKDRKDWFLSEKTRIELEEHAGTLVPDSEVREEYARLAKSLVNLLDMLPDMLERDCGLDGATKRRCVEVIDEHRQTMYEAARDD